MLQKKVPKTLLIHAPPPPPYAPPPPQKKKKKIKAVQKGSVIYVTSQYSNTCIVTAMLEDLKWDLLGSRRSKSQLTMFYKFISNLTDIPERVPLPWND